MEATKHRIVQKMIDFYAGSLHDIEHFLKVYAYASLIVGLEAPDPETAAAAEIAAIVHDIACPLCREKYGSAGGRQQEQESEALLRPFLQEFALEPALLERVIFLVCHHHTYTGVDGLDWRILLEADFLVNASESNYSSGLIGHFYENHVKTAAGKALFASIYAAHDTKGRNHMKTAIRFYTRTGNTEKLAKAIAETLGTPAETVAVPLTEPVDVLFLGCSYYAFDMDEQVKQFLRENKDKIGSIACFGTSAMIKSMEKPLKKVTEPLGIRLLAEEFLCRGSFGPMHKGKPDAADCKAAQAFAKKVAK